jgi:hypothetical protein
MPNTPPNFRAGGNIRPARFVQPDVSADNTVTEAGDNTKIIGISRDQTKYPPLDDLVTGTNYAAIIGDNISIIGDGEVGLVEYGGTVVRGDFLKSDNVGRGVSIAVAGTTLQRYGAIALQSGDTGYKGLVQCMIGSERPAIV